MRAFQKTVLFAFLIFVILFSVQSSKGNTQKLCLATNENGLIYISNPLKKVIQIFDAYGVYIKNLPSITPLSSIQNMSSCPCGGYLLVAEDGKKDVLAIDEMSGEILHRIKGISSIGDISISRDKTRYEAIVNKAKNSIHLYTESGIFIREIPGENKFKEATAILLDIKNQIWIADVVSQKIIELDVKGNLIRSIQKGKGFEINKPIDIESDDQGNIYVLDEKNGFLKLSPSGNLIDKSTFSSDPKPYTLSMDGKKPTLFSLSDTTLTKYKNGFLLDWKVVNPLQQKMQSVFMLRIGSRILTPVGFEAKIIDAPPYIDPKSNRTMVPLRAIAETMKAKVDWNPNLQQITITKNLSAILLWIGKKNAIVNQQTKMLDEAPVIKNNRTYVPLRFIGESFKAQVFWYPETSTIRIVY